MNNRTGFYCIRDTWTGRYVQAFDGRTRELGRLDSLFWALHVPRRRARQIVDILNGLATHRRFVLVGKSLQQLHSAKPNTHPTNSRPIFSDRV